MRVPPPSGIQVAPLSVLCSKITSETSGELPLRIQVIWVASGALSVWVAGALSSRANRLRSIPPMLVNSPPSRILPSACAATL